MRQVNFDMIIHPRGAAGSLEGRVRGDDELKATFCTNSSNEKLLRLFEDGCAAPGAKIQRVRMHPSHPYQLRPCEPIENPQIIL